MVKKSKEGDTSLFLTTQYVIGLSLSFLFFLLKVKKE